MFRRSGGTIPRALEISRQQDERASDTGRKELHRQTELVDKYDLLRTSIDKQRFQLVAYRRERQGIKAHTP